jgi:predicted transcriptional regulator
MTTTVWITDEVKNQIDKIAGKNSVTREGLVDVILRLSLWDDIKVNQAIVIMKAYNIRGATRNEK